MIDVVNSVMVLVLGCSCITSPNQHVTHTQLSQTTVHALSKQDASLISSFHFLLINPQSAFFPVLCMMTCCIVSNLALQNTWYTSITLQWILVLCPTISIRGNVGIF